jgi:hypothetical protein
LLAAAGVGGASALAKSRAYRMHQIKGSYLSTTAAKTGHLSASRMIVEVVLQPANKAGLNSL